MIITLYGKKYNEWTKRVQGELDDRWAIYQLVQTFGWSRDANCVWHACHIDENGEAKIRSMPTIHIVGSQDWVAQGEYSVDPTLVWHYLGQGDEFWLSGMGDCLDFIRGAKWETAPV